MTIWERAVLDTRCGLCGEPIRRGDPVRVYVFPSARRGHVEKVRCAACAGAPVPALPDLPPQHPEPRPPFPFVRVTAHSLPLDFKQRQAREPGEDDA